MRKKLAFLCLPLLAVVGALLFTTPAGASPASECRSGGGIWQPSTTDSTGRDYAGYCQSRTPVRAASSCDGPDKNFLTFRPWYYGLVFEGENGCEMKRPVAGDAIGMLEDNEMELTSYVWKIVFNIMDIILGVISYAAVLFVLIGGFRMLISSGDPSSIVKGKTTITNALIGVVIAIIGSGAVRFVNDTLLGGNSQTISINDQGAIELGGFQTDSGTMWANAIGGFLMIAGICSVIMVVWGGVRLSMSGGDPAAATRARHTVIFALIGAVVMLLASVLVRLVASAVTGS